MIFAHTEKGKTMDDLIRRQAAIEVLRNRWLKTRNYDGIGEDIAEECEIYLKTLPSAQKKGHWNFVGDNLFKCTCCGKMYTTQQLNGLRVYDKDPYCPFFCPNCGADMQEEVSD
jgi:hypothetical protein